MRNRRRGRNCGRQSYYKKAPDTLWMAQRVRWDVYLGPSDPDARCLRAVKSTVRIARNFWRYTRRHVRIAASLAGSAGSSPAESGSFLLKIFLIELKFLFPTTCSMGDAYEWSIILFGENDTKCVLDNKQIRIQVYNFAQGARFIMKCEEKMTCVKPQNLYLQN